MHLRVDDYEIVAFFGCVLVFEICERLWPARPVDRWRDLKLDLLSFAFALAVNRACTHLIRYCIGDVTPAFLAGSVRQLQSLPSFWKIVVAVFMADFPREAATQNTHVVHSKRVTQSRLRVAVSTTLAP